MPRWILFFCVAGYEFLPEERVEYQKRDAARVAERVGIPLERAIAGVSASEVLQRATHPSGEPYWKLNHGGGCQDIPFISSYHDLPGLVATMTDAVIASRRLPALGSRGPHPAGMSGPRLPLRAEPQLRPRKPRGQRRR